MESGFETRIDLTKLTEGVNKIKSEIKKVIIGQDEMIELMLAAVLSNGHILLEGVPGIAKTLAAKLLARTMSVDFSRIQFTPDLMPSDIVGTSVFNMKKSEFEFNRGPVFSNFILIDEINRSPAKTQSALFEVMEERQVTVDGNTYPMSATFLVFATQNPIEHEGTYRLPEAQLDRFLFKLNIGYPSLEEETQILLNQQNLTLTEILKNVKAVVSSEEIILYQQIARNIIIDIKLVEYIAKIVNSTRNHKSFYLGGSPRASLSIMQGAKTIAALRGRDFVTPEDIKYISIPAMRHRVLLMPEKEMEGVKTEDMINMIIEKIEVPR